MTEYAKEETHIKDFLSIEEWEVLLKSIPTRKIVDPKLKAWFQKMKRYYKTYGEEMRLYPGQYELMLKIKKDIEEGQ